MRILAVEDQPEYLEILQDVMQSLGHYVTIARNGAEALEVLERETVDVIMSDVKMPTMNGIEFHERVRAQERLKLTPFIFLTGVGDITEVKAVCRDSCDLLLQKPFPVDKLIQLFAGKMQG